MRQYFPKGTDLSRWSSEEIEAVAAALNARPRRSSAGRHRPRSSTSTYAFSNQPELLRSIEPGVYTSRTFGELCDSHGVVQSMGATGVCWDNSVAESWFGTMKRELAHRRRWTTRAAARRDVIRWIEGWFNSRRQHSSNHYNSPIDWENQYYRRGDGIAA